jgi:hypothetical protein
MLIEPSLGIHRHLDSPHRKGCYLVPQRVRMAILSVLSLFFTSSEVYFSMI